MNIRVISARVIKRLIEVSDGTQGQEVQTGDF
jgi:hypothetical protein